MSALLFCLVSFLQRKSAGEGRALSCLAARGLRFRPRHDSLWIGLLFCITATVVANEVLLLWWVSFPQYAGLEGRHSVVVPGGLWGFAWARRQAREEENHLTFLCRKDEWNQLPKSFPIIVDMNIIIPRPGDQSDPNTSTKTLCCQAALYLS